MAVRTDIFTIDWDVSPRIIWVDISETEAIAQDLYDTCRYYEAQTANMDDDPIIDAAGGEPLGGSVSVGLTVSLLNAQYAFAARPGPDWVICNMTGGNVVAFTDATRVTELYPRYPTAYVSADRTASSSATSQEQTEIQYAAFDGKVHYDVNGTAGTVYPAGTPLQPVNNFADLITIATSRGFTTVQTYSDMAVDDTYEWDGWELIGRGRSDYTITFTNTKVTDCIFEHMVLSGTLDATSNLNARLCTLRDLTNFSGDAESCVMDGTVILSGASQDTVFYDCYDGVPGIGIPDIQVNTCDSLGIWNWQGGIRLSDISTVDTVISLMIAQGRLWVDSTCTEGNIIIKGLADLYGTTNGTTIDKEGLVTSETITEANWTAVVVDDGHVESGTAWPYGTYAHPVNNMADAKAIADARGIHKFHIHGSFTLTGDWSGYQFESDSYEIGRLTLDNAIVDKCVFEKMRVTGTIASGEFTARNGKIVDCTNLFADLTDVQLVGNCSVNPLGYIKGNKITTPNSQLNLDMGGTGSAHFPNMSGFINLSNMTDPACSLHLVGDYRLDMDATCTAGLAVCTGIGQASNLGTAILADYSLPKATWEYNVEATYTTEDILKIVGAVLGGTVSGVGTDTEVFKGLDGVTDRVTTTFDEDGNRLTVTHNV